MQGIPEAQNIKNRELLKEIPFCVWSAATLSQEHPRIGHPSRQGTVLLALVWPSTTSSMFTGPASQVLGVTRPAALLSLRI